MSFLLPPASDNSSIFLSLLHRAPLFSVRLDQKTSLSRLSEQKLAAMDIVLEAFDAYLFDSLYAQLFPATPGPIAYNAIKSATANSTFSSVREEPTAYYNNYQYQPASQYISFSPSKYAYMSSLPRDNMWRQAVSLFTITWYGPSLTPSQMSILLPLLISSP